MVEKKQPMPGERTELILTTYIESLPMLFINVLQVQFIKLLYILGNNVSISDCQRPCHYFDFEPLKTEIDISVFEILSYCLIVCTALGETFPNFSCTVQKLVSEKVPSQGNFKTQQAEDSAGVFLAF